MSEIKNFYVIDDVTKYVVNIVRGAVDYPGFQFVERTDQDVAAVGWSYVDDTFIDTTAEWRRLYPKPSMVRN